MARIVISYRRSSSAAYAGRIHDHLVERFGSTNVFIDVESIDPGADFPQAIQRAVANADALVVVIGPNWAQESDLHGHRRLEDPGDFVRLEILAALESGVSIIPVLVNRSVMPASDDLPEPLRSVAYRNALEIRDDRFHADTDRLVTIVRDGSHRSRSRSRAIASSVVLCIGGAWILDQTATIATEPVPSFEFGLRRLLETAASDLEEIEGIPSTDESGNSWSKPSLQACYPLQPVGTAKLYRTRDRWSYFCWLTDPAREDDQAEHQATVDRAVAAVLSATPNWTNYTDEVSEILHLSSVRSDGVTLTLVIAESGDPPAVGFMLSGEGAVGGNTVAVGQEQERSADLVPSPDAVERRDLTQQHEE